MINAKFITLLLFLFLPFCLVDVFNGFFSYHGLNIPISQIYKLVLLLLFVFTLLNNIYLYVIFILILTIFLYQSFFYTLSLSEDYAAVIRTSFFVLATMSFYKYRLLLTRRHLKIIEAIFFFNFLVIAVSVSSGILGFGLTTYGGQPASEFRGIGYKGFFYAGNELGALLLCLFPIVFITSKTVVRKVTLSLIFIFISFLIGTKTAFISVFFVAIYSVFLLIKISILNKVTLFILLLTSFTAIFIIFQDQIYFKIDAINYVYSNKGIMYLILSGRDSMFNEAFRYTTNNFSSPDFIFGVGSSYAGSKFKSVEMDFADILIWSGVIWFLFVYIFYFCFSFYVLFLLDKKSKKVFGLTLFFLFVASLLAGHVLTSGMLLPILSLYLPYSYVYSKAKFRD